MVDFFVELSVVLALAFFVAIILHKIKQPLLIGYILTGILAGPLFFNILGSAEGYRGFAHIGIAFLLFIVGLHLDVKLIREVGLSSFLIGVGQIGVTALITFLVMQLLGYGFTTSLVIAIAMTFSSTIIIVKILSDESGLEKIYGKISIGVLLVQDIVAIAVLMVLSATLSVDQSSTSNLLIRTIVSGLGVTALTVVLAKYLIPKLVKQVAKSAELFFIFIITWCFGISAVFEFSGFSLEIGALLAGVSLASSQFQYEISSRIKPLRDFFIILFFIFLGSTMLPPIAGIESVGFFSKFGLIWVTLKPWVIDALLLSIFVLALKPLITFFLTLWLGYSSRTGFIAGITLSQISEFSIIVGLLAEQAGFLDVNEVALITLVALITITISTYWIHYGEWIYNRYQSFLCKFDVRCVKEAKKTIKKRDPKIVLFGMHRIGFSVLKEIKKMKKKYLVVDHDPDVVRKLKKQGIPAMYGDVGNVDFLENLHLGKLELLITTVPDFDTNSLVAEHLGKKQKKIRLLVTANQIGDAMELYKLGADYVILPHFLGGHHASQLIAKFKKSKQVFDKERKRSIKDLKERKKFDHEHPKYEGFLKF